MFWVSAVAVAKLLTRRIIAALGASECGTSGNIEVSDTYGTSSIQRESSETESHWSLRKWPSVKSLLTSFSFSEAMSDRVTVDQQRREEQNAMDVIRDDSPVLEEFIRTGQWIQANRGELTSPQTNGQCPNSNQTAADATHVRTGFSRAPGNDGSPDSTNTEAIHESMTYIGGMNYAKYCMEASQAKAPGKQKKGRPPALCVENELNRIVHPRWHHIHYLFTTIFGISCCGGSSSSKNRNVASRDRSPTSFSTSCRYSC